MTSNNSHSNKPLQQLSNSNELTTNNPLLVLDPDADTFRLDSRGVEYLQRLRNQIANEKINLQINLDDPQYQIKTIRLLAYLDGKLEVLTDLIAAHFYNLQATDSNPNQ